MSASSSLYKILPVSGQNIAVSLFGLGWKKRRFGGVFESELVKFKERESFSADQWHVFQTQALKRLLIHAYHTVPFYKQAFIRHGLNINQLEKLTASRMSALPILEKNDLRQFGTTTLVSSSPERKGEFFASSGSTGTPTQILFSHAMHQRWSAAFESRIRHWAGVTRFDARGTIGGRRVLPDGEARPPYYRYNFFEKQAYFSAYHISRLTAADYLKGIRNHHLQYMTGYAMSNFFLARFLVELGLESPALKAVITSSEKLTPEMRKVFAAAYHCKTYDSWSGIEACGLVSECEHGSLHLSPDVGIVEIVDDQGRPVNAGETGEVICTGLINFDQPLIRYRIGDRMRLSAKVCSCGRNMPVIDEIMGREEDVVVGADGRELVRFHGIFVGLPDLLQGQVVQETLKDFTIRIVVQPGWNSENEAVIRLRMKSQLGEVNLKIVKTDAIPTGPNGKFKAVISHVKRNA